MKIQWTFRNCENDKERARAYFNAKVRRLKRRLSRLGASRCRVDLTLYRHPNREAWELRGVLRLPTGTLVTSDEQRDLMHVIDEVIDELAGQVRRHKARIRKDHVIRRRRLRGGELVSAAPYLEQDASQDRRESFFELLSPLLDNVREHAKYEIRVLEDDDVIPKGELSFDDLVDEVLLLAYDRFKLRPPTSLMEAWLMELLHERLNALAGQEQPISLATAPEDASNLAEEPTSRDSDDVNYWLSHVFERDDDVSLEELVPDDAVAESLLDVEESEKRRRLQRILDRLPKRQRQALMLHEASGFETAEIAGILKIEDSNVEQLIEQAKETLRKNLADLAAPRGRN